MNLKIYKLTNFFQNIIVKNMFFFISLGIFKILSLKWNIYSDIIDILMKYIIPVAIAYTTGNIIEKKIWSNSFCVSNNNIFSTK